MEKRGKRDAGELNRDELRGNGELGGDYARDPHREGFGDDYARDGGFSGGGAHDQYARDEDRAIGEREEGPASPERRESTIGKASE